MTQSAKSIFCLIAALCVTSAHAAASSEDESTASEEPLSALSSTPIVITAEDCITLPSINDYIAVSANERKRNEDFRTYTKNRDKNYIHIQRGEELELHFYRYTATKEDTLQTVTARLMLRIETIATANAIQTQDGALTGVTLFFPDAPGLFIPEDAQSPYELMLKKAHAPDAQSPRYCINGRQYVFLQNERMTNTERAFFLDTNMVMPLEKHVLTSRFGYRTSPISGEWKFHSGIDLASPLGSDVFACKAGTVTVAASKNAVYGNYIILQHAGGMTSVYAHLSKISVKVGDAVLAGRKIGEVGSTGMSTGPHLHFEVHVNGNPTDPGALMKKQK